MFQDLPKVSTGGSGGSGVSDTDWMGYYLVPYSNCYPQFVLCVKGYSKIEIKTKGTNTGMRIDIYTANDLSSNSKKSTETLLGTVLSTTGEEVNISDNDYIWFYCHDASNGVNKEGYYRLLV